MKNKGYVYTDRVSEAENGIPAIDFYASRYSMFDRAVWQGRFRSGLVCRHGRPLAADEPVRTGETLTYHRPPWEEPPVPLDVQLAYQDETVLVVCKPAGLPTLPGDPFLDHTLLALVRKRWGDRWSPLHRLDRGTSGLVLFAGDRTARRLLGTAMQQGRVRKSYLAVVSGQLPAGSIRVDTPIGRISHAGLEAVAAADPSGRPAQTTFRTVRPLDAGRWLVMAIPHTGRTHQIRIHAACAGFPLAGDPVYRTPDGLPDRDRRPGETGFQLHAWRMRFLHPVTGRWVSVTDRPEWTLP